MTPAHQKNIVGGAILVAFGGCYAAYAATQLSVGSFSAMGPGMFPLLLGVCLAGLGLLMLAPAVFRVVAGRTDEGDGRPWERIEWRPLAAVIGAIAAFAALVGVTGLAPAVVALVVIGSRADSRLGVAGVGIVSASLVALAYLIFELALELPLELLVWPF